MRGVKKKKEKKKKVEQKALCLSFYFTKSISKRAKKGKINYQAHLNIIPCTISSLLPKKKKPKLLSKLIACCGKTGIKENNQGVRINLGQPPYL